MSQKPIVVNPPKLDLNNIQGDVIEGLPKRLESFIFLAITNPTQFRQRLKAIIPLITTTNQAVNDRKAIEKYKADGKTGLLTVVGTNIAFSHTGLLAIGINDDLNDSTFSLGQLADAANLLDPGTVTGGKTDPAWEPEFKQHIHVCLIITGESLKTVRQRQTQLDGILLGTVKTIIRVDGAVRPGAESGREHFGYQDGLSQPPIIGFRDPNPGEDPTPAGVIVLGGDQDKVTRPAWAKDGSFLAFRKLRQFVPEFNDWIKMHPIKGAGLSPEQGSDLLGARLVGRWKSGAPVVRNPTKDNPAEGKDDKLNKFVNNFDYGNDPGQVKCPFAAHLRKMNPRASFPGSGPVRERRISRQGIPYGPEVDEHEKYASITVHDRGLLFACYQSNLSLGFNFLQRIWANNSDFPKPIDGSGGPASGFDALIGQTDPLKPGAKRFVQGSDPGHLTAPPLELPSQPFVVPLGGEYFFSPSISALKTKFAA